MQSLKLPDLKKLHELLKQVADRELLPRFAKVACEMKADGSVVTAADLAVQQSLRMELARHWPEYGFLGEEMTEQERQDLLAHQGAGFWCLDPLDGTSNFARGIPFFSISLALIVAGKVVSGLVYDPTRGECFSAQDGQGAYLNRDALEVCQIPLPLKSCMAVVDFKRLKQPLRSRLAECPPYCSQRNFGSVALEWCWLAAGRFHVYLHGSQKLWDYAAGCLILHEAGGFASNLEGGAVANPELDSSSVIAALDQRLFLDWQAWILDAA